MYLIERLEILDGNVQLVVAQLLEGEPDGHHVGLPLEVMPTSPRFDVTFTSVGRIEIVPEPTANLSAKAQRTAPFLYEVSESDFKRNHAWGATTFNFGRRFGSETELVHYVVYAEAFLVHILALDTPVVAERSGEPNPTFQRTGTRPLN